MEKINFNRRHFKYSLITSAIYILLNQSTYALEPLLDHDLRDVNGQDGVQINLDYSNITIDDLYWQDSAGTSANVSQDLRAQANTINIIKNSSDDALRSTLNVGSDADDRVGINFNLKLAPTTISMKNFSLCGASGQTYTCDQSIGNLALQTQADTEFGLITQDGLFNKDAQAELTLGLKNINIYTGLAPTTIANDASLGIYNQLILKNTNFNFAGKGIAYIDPVEGFVIKTNVGNVNASTTSTPSSTLGYVDFERVADASLPTGMTRLGTFGGQNSGLNLEFMTKTNASVDYNNPVYSLDNAKGLIRVGASGRIVNGMIQLRGTDGKINSPTKLNTILGFASDASETSPTATGSDAIIMGSNGIGLRIRGEFTGIGDSMLGGNAGLATTLEIGGAGHNSYGFEFGDLQPLVVGSSQRAYFDSGNVYLNLANTKHLQMPENVELTTKARFGASNSYLTSASDYVQQIHNESTNPYSFVMAIRGADFQSLSKRGRFTSSPFTSDLTTGTPISETAGLDNKWGLGLPFHNLNANLAMYTKGYTGNVFTLDNQSNSIGVNSVTNSQRLGFALALSVDGKNTDGSKTTSILVIDSGDRNFIGGGSRPANYYLGLRNIDMLLRGYGTVGFENGNFNMNLPDLLMVMSAQLAAGYLPGARYANNTLVSANVFNTNDDVLMGLKLKLLGDMNFALVPNNQINGNYNNGNRLSIIGEYALKDGTVQISDPIDGSMIGLDNMEGKVRFNNALVVGNENVDFNYSFHFNPEKKARDVFRVHNVNFYPPLPTSAATTPDPGQRIGEMALTGGRLNMEMSIKPRNGLF